MFEFSSLLTQLHPANFGINLLDVIIVLVVLFYAYEGYSLGFTLAALDLGSFILSFIIALKFYPLVAKGIIALFGLPIGFANAIAFFLIAFVSEIVLGLLSRRLLRVLPKLPKTHIVTRIFGSFDHWLGFVPGIISAFIVLSFLLSVIVSLPSSPLVKQLVTDSKIGARLIANTSFFEARLNDVFGGALEETLNFITVKPQSNETVSLHFSTKEGTVDGQAEQEMLRLVNIERDKAGLPPVEFDTALRDVARAHSQDMFERGYFSHYSPEGQSPFDRMNKAGIAYAHAGENLALAPSTSLAMQGLMNSPGHRANILNPDFGKIGIGVIDGGIYGKMYSQEFTD
jgi:uncharacterized protein YkwD